MRNTKRKLKWLSVLLAVIFSMSILAACTPQDDSGGDGQENYYSVTYYGENDESLQTLTVKSGDKAFDWTPEKSGYEFDAWYSDSARTQAYNFNTAVTSDMNLYAKFTEGDEQANYYTVTFYDGSDVLRTQTVKEGEQAFDWSPEKSGYDFDAWYTDSAATIKYNFSGAVNANISLYAAFTPKGADPAELQYPVTLSKDGLQVTYGFEGEEKTIDLGEKAIYIDGRLSDEQIEGYDYVYNSFKQAMANLVDGTETDPMEVYIAPYVYWIHNPNSTSTTEAYGMYIDCDYLHITGLTDNPYNVVIAGNYGHNEGYDGGNWTMFSVTGDGLTLRNVTFGDYCNVDLVYPLDPSLNVPKRTDNVTQGQIASYNGDKLYAENCNFISRLNMMPFNNSGRALYVNCHMESTDDSLNGSSQSVYLGCDFEFYSGKPWYSTGGSKLLNCTMEIVHYNVSDSVQQYLSKAQSPYVVIDSQFISDYDVPVTIGWTDVLSDTYRSYYSNVTHNGEQITFDDGGRSPDAGVDITGTDALKAYKVVDGSGNIIYNVYNLLRGSDDWDPLGQKEIITSLGATDVPTSLTAYTSKNESAWGTTYVTEATIESGADTVTLGYDIFGPQSTDYTAAGDVEWSISQADEQHVKLTPSADGKTCLVEGINQDEEAALVIVTAKDASGLEGVVALTVRPTILPAPEFTSQPVIKQNDDGTAQVDYELDLGERADMSRIIWYICDDAQGTNPIQIAVGRGSEPLKSIPLEQAYVGKYLQVSIERKHIRSEYAEADIVTSTTPVAQTGITVKDTLSTDFSTFSTAAQPQLIEGMWTVDGYCPADTQEGYIPLDGTEVSGKYSDKVAGKWTPADVTNNAWSYGTGAKNGFLDYSGIYQTARGARLRYTPVGDSFGDMDVTLKVAPGKTASQGFGSDYQYMDIMIKFDNQTLTGYGLRIYRTSGDSCDFVLMQYADGKSKEICEPVRSSCYLTECTIRVWTEDGKLYAHVESSQPQSSGAADKGYAAEVDLTADITTNTYGGFCLLHTGTVGDNATYIGSLDIAWNN